MKLNELITTFVVATTNEEAALLEKMHSIEPYHSFSEREQVVIDNLVRKSLVSKINNKGNLLVVKNDVED